MNKIYVVGIGPGEYEQMTIRAEKVLRDCDVIVGYTVYADLLREHFPEKEFLTTPMRQEEKRCRLAFEQAAAGRTVAMVCSGDAGVYGMSGLMLEIGTEYPQTEVEMVPGVTAAVAGAALLGAPLGHDFAVISLSNLLTPWETIEHRIVAAAKADFVICFYNPSSKKRKDFLKKACELMLQHKPETTICGIAARIAREGERTEICTLQELRERQTDMFTTVFVGNSETRAANGRILTPRGYAVDTDQRGVIV
ncbi:MAG: precorrin-3B C(17)-methyltransferase [Clostridiales bacterium]|nr:precorrin-3B C(17)-methyltransferase [Clostridiales bacterium]